MKHLHLKRKHRGFTLVEFGLVAVLIAFVTGLIGWGWIKYRDEAKGRSVGSAVAQSMRLLNVRVNNNYALVTTTAGVATGAFDNTPEFAINAGRTTVNHTLAGPGLGAITFAPAAANANGVVTINDVPNAACLPLVQMLDPMARTISIGGVDVRTAAAAQSDLTLVNCATGALSVFTVGFL